MKYKFKFPYDENLTPVIENGDIVEQLKLYENTCQGNILVGLLNKSIHFWTEDGISLVSPEYNLSFQKSRSSEDKEFHKIMDDYFSAQDAFYHTGEQYSMVEFYSRLEKYFTE